MKFSKVLFTAAALVTSLSVNAGAQVTWSTGAPLGGFLGLSGPTLADPSACGACTLGPGVGNISGGVVRSASVSGVALRPGGTVGNFLSVGPSNNNTTLATLTLAPGVLGIGFLWGSPDTYNTLRVETSNGSWTSFTPGAGFIPAPQSGEEYVRFFAASNLQITKLEFSSVSQNAFEASNFSVSTVPEPSTYALMGAGLLALGFVSKRRKRA